LTDSNGKENGGPALPTNAMTVQYGMTLRDYFAAKAMQGLIASPKSPSGAIGDVTDKLVAKLAYTMADAMLEARK